MSEALLPFEDPHLTELLERERLLEAEAADLDSALSGLRDIDLSLRLAAARLRVANRLLEAADPARGDPQQDRAGQIRERAGAALRALEELRSINVSEEQKGEVFRGQAYAETKELFQEFVLRGGGPLLQAQEGSERRRAAVARAVAGALRKLSGPDADYPALFRTERLPGILRGLANIFLPILAPEDQKPAPYGIPEGQETIQTAQRMKMPLSQAIHYLEHELLPRLEQELAAAPGDPELRRQTRVAQERLREYRGIRVLPRATPINLEKGFYTDWLTQYTADGELLVSINLPVRFRSGTNLDRLRDLLRQEVVRRLSGRGVSDALDQEYRYRRSLASGRRGSSRVPSQKLDFDRCYRELRASYPALARLEDDRELHDLIDFARSAGRRAAERRIKALLARGESEPLSLP